MSDPERVVPQILTLLREHHHAAGRGLSARQLSHQLSKSYGMLVSASTVEQVCTELCESECPPVYRSHSRAGAAWRYRWITPEQAAARQDARREYRRRAELAVTLEARLKGVGFASAHSRGTVVCLDADEAAMLMRGNGLPSRRNL